MSVHIGAKKGQIAETVLLPGDPLRAKFIAENFLDSPKQYNEIRNMLGYTGTYKGVPVSVQGTGMGMPSIGIYSWELMTQFDVENLIRIGTAGAISEDVHIKDIVLSVGASTNSSYVDNFLDCGQLAPVASWDLLCKARDKAEELNLKIKAGNTFSSDIFYQLKPDYYSHWADMGCLAVEMEAAALYMNAAYNKKNALAILTISDSLITGESTTAEERQTSFTDMMKLALEVATK